MSRLRLTITPVSSPLKTAFSISRGSKTHAETIRISLESDAFRGRGECVPYGRYGETIESVTSEIDGIRADLEAGMDRASLQDALPAGAARCAVDAALWDLEAKTRDMPVWKLAGLPEPKPVPTAVTIVLGEPGEMAAAAKAASGKLLKLKLGGLDDMARIEAVHGARPDAKLIVDGNEGLVPEDFPNIAAAARELGVVLIEQPFPADDDRALVSRAYPISVCADESAHVAADIETLAKAYDAVNVKLDKTGGLTEAIKMVRTAERSGMGIMVGCMVAGSLSMAPAMMLSGLADAVDLDGPLWLAEDVADGLVYEDGLVHPPTRALWG